MIHLHIAPAAQPLDYATARAQALARAHVLNMAEPVIVSWRRLGHADRNRDWAAYGRSHGGEADIQVGDDFEFIVMDSDAYESAHRLPLLANLRDARGTEYLCLTPLLGRAATPGEPVCQPLDEWTADQL